MLCLLLILGLAPKTQAMQPAVIPSTLLKRVLTLHQHTMQVVVYLLIL